MCAGKIKVSGGQLQAAAAAVLLRMNVIQLMFRPGLPASLRWTVTLFSCMRQLHEMVWIQRSTFRRSTTP
ncbi:hypothetical protein EDF62_3339 [Leucobacter luti]|uniref:Uncharacterized protein n=1 Tax=Leucobacter luti TaxID=340320 RepID=A0A4R6RU68_9MICO|nr:hypothetical protein EDF62_3339 [Leucobacter luti]